MAASAALLVESRTPQESFVFHLGEKIGRAQIRNSKQNFTVVLRVVAGGDGKARAGKNPPPNPLPFCPPERSDFKFQNRDFRQKKFAPMETTKIALFKGKKIRKTLFQNEWWFSILDIISTLTDSPQPKTYWAKMKVRDKEISQPFPFWEQLKLPAEDEKMRETDCANTEGIFRIIQSIPSSKAEPFKRWLAKVGYERVQEIENPELATKRTRILYKLKGYSEDWIEKRMRGIAIREELTDEWQKRGAKEQRDYEILTAEISKATFGVTPSEYKNLKGLKRQNLRDHMDDFELIFSMLGERSTTEIHRQEKSEGLPKLKADAGRGGKVAGVARKELEKELGRSVVSKKNFLAKKEDGGKLKDK